MPPVAATRTVTAPAAWAGAFAVIFVESTYVKLVACIPSKVTWLAPTKLVPVMVTKLPPAVGPLGGVILVMTGLP